MKSILFSCLLFGLLLCATSHAQTACPPGMEAYGAGVCGYSRSDEPAPQQATPQLPEAPPARWASRWGAIATDEPHGILGAVTGLSSKEEAQKAAMEACRAKGGSPCKFEIAYDNECAAMIVSDKGYNTPAAATVEKAVQLGMQTCKSSGDTELPCVLLRIQPAPTNSIADSIPQKLRPLKNQRGQRHYPS